MSKIVNKKVICACCGKQVNVERTLSFSCEKIGLSGNKHTFLQYRTEECPECHYTSFDIENSVIRVTKGMLNAFRMKPGTEKIADPIFVSLLKSADIYEKNKEYQHYAYALRLASFYAEEAGEKALSLKLLNQANEGLQLYFESREELDISDIRLAIILIDGNRRLRMLSEAKKICDDILELVKDENGTELLEIRRLIAFENQLIESRDFAEHYLDEVL